MSYLTFLYQDIVEEQRLENAFCSRLGALTCELTRAGIELEQQLVTEYVDSTEQVSHLKANTLSCHGAGIEREQQLVIEYVDSSEKVSCLKHWARVAAAAALAAHWPSL